MFLFSKKRGGPSYYQSLNSWFLHQCFSHECLHPRIDAHIHMCTQTPAHIHLSSRQINWSNLDIIVVLIRTCIGFPIGKTFFIVKWLLLLSLELEPRLWAGGGEPYRQEERENHLGTKGAEIILHKDKNTPCTACHSNPIGLCTLLLLYMISRCYGELGKSFNIEEWFYRALQHSWCLTAVAQFALGLVLFCPMESRLCRVKTGRHNALL